MTAGFPDIAPLGDSALIVRVRDKFEDAPDETLNDVLRILHQIKDADIPGVIELAPAYTSVAVFFDPIRVIRAGAKPEQIIDWLGERIAVAVGKRGKRKQKDQTACVTEIPVCYDPNFALDLDHVAEHAHVSAAEVIELYSAPEYRVSCIGFTPGFPFLSGLDKKIATPRRDTPRKEIPAGSVGIGGAQTGVYPLRSPGGWNIIGRTPLALFDPAKSPPALLQAGDRVRFRSITREEFDAI
ncbi:MAG: 5-oxoprolinase subunit PxpB [Verrucomicrobiota bacterium]